MTEPRFRIDLEPAGKNRWKWTVWAWGPYYSDGGSETETWRPPWVAIEEFRPGLGHVDDYTGTKRTLFDAELAARRYVAYIQTCLSAHVRHQRATIRFEV